MEEWRDVPGYNGWYQASDAGRVRSWKPPGTNSSDNETRADVPRILNPGKTRGDYFAVSLCLAGTVKNFRMNRLILMAFDRQPYVGEQACHRNGDRQDNRLSNLYWGSHAQNQADKVRHGTQVRGEGIPSAKLTQDLVDEIRLLWSKGGHTVLELAGKYGVSGPTLWKAATGKTWRHTV